MNDSSKRTNTAQKLKTLKCRVDDLRIGMYVSDLDCDWLDTPFLLQGFTITTEAEVETLRAHCKHVFIEYNEDYQLRPADDNSALNDGLQKNKQNYKAQLSAEEEHEQARKIYHANKATAINILNSAAQGKPVSLPEAETAVRSCVQSILRNPDALLWMSKIRNRDEYTAEHCLNVSILAIAFGRHLELTEEELYTVGLAGLLHDVGKMRVPAEILNKPGKLTDKEFKIISTHAVHGRNLLQQTPQIPKAVIEAAHGHHERIDGGGYPLHTKGEDISPYARIIAIVDSYDAITSNRCYSDARPVTEAMKILYENRGKQFDEELTLDFIQFVGLYPPGSIVELENGMVGLVLAKNKGAQHLPKIIRVRDEDKQPCAYKLLDLSDIARGKLDKSYLIKHLHIDGSFGVHIKEHRASSWGL